jgi:hypothetical protein
MFLTADMTIRQVDSPASEWCCSGHKAPASFKRGGADSPEEPTRFFSVSGYDIDSIYCEPCLVIARHMAMLKKKGLL